MRINQIVHTVRQAPSLQLQFPVSGTQLAELLCVFFLQRKFNFPCIFHLLCVWVLKATLECGHLSGCQDFHAESGTGSGMENKNKNEMNEHKSCPTQVCVWVWHPCAWQPDNRSARRIAKQADSQARPVFDSCVKWKLIQFNLSLIRFTLGFVSHLSSWPHVRCVDSCLRNMMLWPWHWAIN